MVVTTTVSEAQVTKAIFRRLVPFLMLCYFVAYVDRVNVGFAALTMNRDLGFSPTVFGTGAGIFFLGYFLFEVPSNLAVAKFGAGRWIMRIMLSWGVIAAAMAFITGEKSFYTMRFVLGIAEAGFFPGILFYLTLWFPSAYRGSIMGWFMAAIPISTIVGAPLSGLILGLDGTFGLHGWQWLYILEGLPAVILALLVPFVLTDTPERATWLAADARAWLIARLAQERREREAVERFSVVKALLDPRVLALSLVYFGAIACTFGLGFWLPQIIKGMGLTNTQTGFATAIPYLFGMFGMVTLGRRSDRVGRAAVPLRLRPGRRGGRPDRLHAGRWPDRDHDRVLCRRLRLPGQPTGVLGDPVLTADRCGRGRRTGADQRGRRPGRVLRTVRGRRHQGRHRQL